MSEMNVSNEHRLTYYMHSLNKKRVNMFPL